MSIRGFVTHHVTASKCHGTPSLLANQELQDNQCVLMDNSVSHTKSDV